MTGHDLRVGALAWNGSVLSTGSRDRKILHRDVRVPNQYIHELKGHRQEVCGLKWNTQTDQLASGGNDNKLFIWEKTNVQPLFRFPEHKAAVKAIAWSPHQRGLLASGGGTADKKIRYWNTMTGNLLSEWDTGSQVSSIREERELELKRTLSRFAISCGLKTPTKSFPLMGTLADPSPIKSQSGSIPR